MIECPFAAVLVALAAISGLTALARRRSHNDANTKRTEELTRKLQAAAREADEHIAAYVRGEHTRGGRHG